MTAPKNAFEIFQLLEKSNCGNCGEKTCLAFAAAVFKSRHRLSECPRLDPSVIAQFSTNPALEKPSG
jgi:CO dehydrogenase/acetyl-CoA synthase gamma subunit (corrinoid Fe-S protein)